MTSISNIWKQLTSILSNVNNFRSLEVVDRVKLWRQASINATLSQRLEFSGYRSTFRPTLVWPLNSIHAVSWLNSYRARPDQYKKMTVDSYIRIYYFNNRLTPHVYFRTKEVTYYNLLGLTSASLSPDCVKSFNIERLPLTRNKGAP